MSFDACIYSRRNDYVAIKIKGIRYDKYRERNMIRCGEYIFLLVGLVWL